MSSEQRKRSRIKADALEVWLKDFVATEKALGVEWGDKGIETARNYLLQNGLISRQGNELRPVGTKCMRSELGVRLLVTGDDRVVVVGHLPMEDGGWTEIVRADHMRPLVY